jgi:GntR family transcriptional regulator
LRSSLPTLQPDTVLVENDLVDSLSASRNTVRMVLQLLASEGLVNRGPKVGTTVRTSTVLPIDELRPISDWGAERTTYGRVLESLVISAPAAVARRLELTAHAPLAVIETLALEDETPIALCVSYVGWPGRPGGGLVKDEPDILSLLERELEVCVGESDTTVAAMASDAQTAALLEIHEGEPLLFLEDLLRDVEGRPRALSQIRYRGDRVWMSARSHRGASDRSRVS